MQRLISLFAAAEHEPRLSLPASGEPPGPDYGREPEYFQHLLAYLREQKRAADQEELVAEDADVEGVLA